MFLDREGQPLTGGAVGVVTEVDGRGCWVPGARFWEVRRRIGVGWVIWKRGEERRQRLVNLVTPDGRVRWRRRVTCLSSLRLGERGWGGAVSSVSLWVEIFRGDAHGEVSADGLGRLAAYQRWIDVLGLVETTVETASRQQLVVRALLGHFATIKH